MTPLSKDILLFLATHCTVLFSVCVSSFGPPFSLDSMSMWLGGSGFIQVGRAIIGDMLSAKSHRAGLHKGRRFTQTNPNRVTYYPMHKFMPHTEICVCSWHSVCSFTFKYAWWYVHALLQFNCVSPDWGMTHCFVTCCTEVIVLMVNVIPVPHAITNQTLSTHTSLVNGNAITYNISDDNSILMTSPVMGFIKDSLTP